LSARAHLAPSLLTGAKSSAGLFLFPSFPVSLAEVKLGHSSGFLPSCFSSSKWTPLPPSTGALAPILTTPTFPTLLKVISFSRLSPLHFSLCQCFHCYYHGHHPDEEFPYHNKIYAFMFLALTYLCPPTFVLVDSLRCSIQRQNSTDSCFSSMLQYFDSIFLLLKEDLWSFFLRNEVSFESFTQFPLILRSGRFFFIWPCPDS